MKGNFRTKLLLILKLTKLEKQPKRNQNSTMCIDFQFFTSGSVSWTSLTLAGIQKLTLTSFNRTCFIIKDVDESIGVRPLRMFLVFSKTTLMKVETADLLRLKKVNILNWNKTSLTYFIEKSFHTASKLATTSHHVNVTAQCDKELSLTLARLLLVITFK